MKNGPFLGLLAAATALVVSAVSAPAQEAYSANAIGVIRKTVPAGKQALMSVPLDQSSDEGAGFVFSDVPAIAAMPNGSVVTFWDVTNQHWVAQTKTVKYGWGAVTNRLVSPGEAFFLKNNESTNVVLVVSGEVPNDSQISRGLPKDAQDLIANPYPVSTPFTDLSFVDEAQVGSVVTFWDEDTQRWVAQSKTAKYGWGAATNRTIKAAEGFFLKSYGDSIEWTEVRPYTWPK